MSHFRLIDLLFFGTMSRGFDSPTYIPPGSFSGTSLELGVAWAVTAWRSAGRGWQLAGLAWRLAAPVQLLERHTRSRATKPLSFLSSAGATSGDSFLYSFRPGSQNGLLSQTAQNCLPQSSQTTGTEQAPPACFQLSQGVYNPPAGIGTPRLK